MDNTLFDISGLGNGNIIDFLLRFLLNICSILIFAYFVYYKQQYKKNYFFTLVFLNILVFLVCFSLQNAKLSLGFAFGILAIFSILRYRTTTVRIKEMTYIFAAITIALINSIITENYNPLVIIISNLIIIATGVILEYFFINKERQKTIIVEKIELIKPENHKQLLADLRERTGLNIKRFEIGNIDFLRDVARVRIYYDREN